MGAEFITEIARVAKEKGVDRRKILEALAESIRATLKKRYGYSEEDIEVEVNEESGDIDIGVYKEVVEEVTDPARQISLEEARRLFGEDEEIEIGDELLIPISLEDFSRVAIQTLKQIFSQKLREAEVEAIMSEFKDRKGELVTGYVRRVEKRRGRKGGNIIVNLGKVEAEGILPESEQIPKEVYQPGDKIKVLLKEIDTNPRTGAPKLILSRSDPNFLKELFKLEVPEVYEGVVEIKSVARDVGVRAKVAVKSNDPDVDPVGACVGVRGARIQNIVQELSGEKIDIVLWSEDPAQFVENALAPAEIIQVIIDEASHSIEVVVPDDQLSLAIGSKGRNVKLASELTGWNIDIKSESEYLENAKKVKEALRQIEGITDFDVEILFHSGYFSVSDIANSKPEEIEKATGISLERVKKYVESAKKLLEESGEGSGEEG